MVTAADVETAYRWAAEHEFAGSSELYRGWALEIAEDVALRTRLAGLPFRKAQPHLVFAAARLRGAPIAPGFATWLRERWDDVEPTILTRATQTNEVARCGTILPALARIPGPVALLEVGASAGLCLLMDRYSYRYSTDRGPVILPGEVGAPVIETRLTGQPAPTAVPDIVWRAGVDLHPLDPRDADDVAWLETLVWPEHEERRRRLRDAVAVAAADPPRVVRGDLVTALPALAAEAPAGATLVVMHTAVMNYLPEDRRRRAADVIRATGARWISQEGIAVLDEVRRRLPVDLGSPDRYVLALDGEPLALTGFHGGVYDALQPR